MSSKTPSSAGRTLGSSYAHASPSSSFTGKKRKIEYIDLTSDAEDEQPANIHSSPSASRPQKAAKKAKTQETRLRRYCAYPFSAFLERLERVRTQRMFLIDRRKGSLPYNEEHFDLAGSTGNVYSVTIDTLPSCTCPDYIKGNQCKHIIYILVNVLKVPEDLACQRAFISHEVDSIFANAPKTPQSLISVVNTDENTNGKRKPIEGDCPVCVMPMKDGEPIVWCKAACGNNLHKTCFEQWARSKPGETQCVYCRTPWQADAANAGNLKRIARTGEGGRLGPDGYVNLANDLGMARVRDTSTYHSYAYCRRRNGSYW